MNSSRLLLPLLLLGAFTASATPLETGHIPDEANWYVHADLDNLRSTSVGTLVADAIEAEHGDKLKAVKRMFSLNPFTDLHGITLWGNGEKDQAAVVIRGTFDREHLTDLIGAGNDHKTTTHQSNTIHSWMDDKEKTQFGSFFKEDTVIISEQRQLVAQTLDVLDGRSEPTQHSPASGPVSFISGMVSLEEIEIKGDEAKLLEKAKSMQTRFFEKDNRLHATIVVEATNTKEAKRMGKVLDGIIALGELTNEDIANLDIQAEVKVEDGSKVHATLSIPSDHILNAIKEAGDLGNL